MEIKIFLDIFLLSEISLDINTMDIGKHCYQQSIIPFRTQKHLFNLNILFTYQNFYSLEENLKTQNLYTVQCGVLNSQYSKLETYVHV